MRKSIFLLYILYLYFGIPLFFPMLNTDFDIDGLQKRKS